MTYWFYSYVFKYSKLIIFTGQGYGNSLMKAECKFFPINEACKDTTRILKGAGYNDPSPVITFFTGITKRAFEETMKSKGGK